MKKHFNTVNIIKSRMEKEIEEIQKLSGVSKDDAIIFLLENKGNSFIEDVEKAVYICSMDNVDLYDKNHSFNFHIMVGNILESVIKERPEYVDVFDMIVNQSNIKYGEGNNVNILYQLALKGMYNDLKMMIDKKIINPSVHENWLFIEGCVSFNINIIKLLLSYDEVNPFDKDNEAFYKLLEAKRLDVIELLFERDDQNYFQSDVKKFLEEFIKMNYIKGVSHIINNYEFDISNYGVKNYLKEIIINKYHEMFDIFIKHKDVDMDKYLNIIISTICEFNDFKIAEKLFYDPEIKFNSKTSEYINKAIRNGQYDLVKMFLESDKVDPTIQDHKAFWTACKYGQLDILKLIVQDGRIDCSVNFQDAYRETKEDEIKEYLIHTLRKEKIKKILNE